MFGHMEHLGIELERAWLTTQGMTIPDGSFDQLVIAAMGGSAAAADYFSVWSRKESPIPVTVVRGGSLPGHINTKSLVIALSYSGQTDEVHACYVEARARGAQRIAIAVGGELEVRAAADGTPFHRLTYDSSPRAALAHALAPLLRIGQRLGLVSMCDPDINAVREAHRTLVESHLGVGVPAETNPAKQLAELVVEGSPIIILGEEHLVPTARRAKNQFAENAKMLVSYEELPEAVHNTIVGLKGSRSNPVGLAFQSPTLARKHAPRDEMLANLFGEAGGELVGLPTRGISRLADMIEATAWGDYLSCYAALLRGVDPTPTPELTRMRSATSRTAVARPA